MSAQPISPAQSAVLTALASGATHSAAAKIAGVHRSSIHNWVKDPAFSQELETARQEYIETLRDELHELSAIALRELRYIIEDRSTSASVRLRAITLVLTRPVYPKPGWTLPAPVNTQAEENYLRKAGELALELKSYQQADSLVKAVNEAVAAKPPTPPIRQNSTLFDTSGGLVELPLDRKVARPATASGSTLFDTFVESVEASTPPTPEPAGVAAPLPKRPPRNAPCPCGSRIKFKKCCGK